MKKSIKGLMLVMFVLPVMFVLSACGMTTEQVFNERIPLIKITAGEYQITSLNFGGRNVPINDIDEFIQHHLDLWGLEQIPQGNLDELQKDFYDIKGWSIDIVANVLIMNAFWGGTVYSIYTADAFGVLTLANDMFSNQTSVENYTQRFDSLMVYSSGVITWSFVESSTSDGLPGAGTFIVLTFERV